MFLALLHTSSRYQLRYTRQHKCHLFFSLRIFCETKNSKYGSETEFAHWAGSCFFHIESYYSQQIKGGSSLEDPGLNHQNYKTCQSFQMHHVEKRLPPCEQNVSTTFFTSALPLFFGRFGVSASFGYDPPTRVKRINDLDWVHWRSVKINYKQIYIPEDPKAALFVDIWGCWLSDRPTAKFGVRPWFLTTFL